MEMIVKQKQLRNNWIKVVEGNLPVFSLPGNCRLRVRENGRGKAIVLAHTQWTIRFDIPLIIKQGSHYKLELLKKRG